MLMLKKNPFEMVAATAADSHPPLYYFIAKIFTMVFGYSVTSVKLASIVPVILILLVVKHNSTILFKEKARFISTIFALLIAFCPVAFTLNVEIRMYTWAMFFVTCSGIYAYRLYNEPTNRKLLSIFILTSLGAAYTHYYAALTECFVYLFLFISLLLKNKTNWKLYCFISVCTTLGYLPWIPTFIKQLSYHTTSWWLTTFNGNSILSTFSYLFNGEYAKFFILTFIIICISGFYTYRKVKTDVMKFALLSILTFILTIATGCIISILIKPLFLNRYMYPAAGLLFLAIGILISYSDHKRILQTLLIALILINFPFSFHEIYMREYKNGTESFKTFFSNTVKGSNIATNIDHFYYTIFPYYLPNNKLTHKIDKDTRGYIVTDKSASEIDSLFHGQRIQKVYTGNIDSVYYFNVYYIE